MLTYHDYNGNADGANLAKGVIAAQKLGKALGKPTMITESFGRGSRSDDPAKRKWDDPTGDSLHSVLRGVNGCIEVRSQASCSLLVIDDGGVVLNSLLVGIDAGR